MAADQTISIDPNELAAHVRQLAKTLASMHQTERTSALVMAEREGGREGALLLKRTYKVERGRCVLAPEEEQNPICFEEVPYAELEPPRVAPIIAADDSLAWKPATDVVIQGSAYAYAPKTTKTVASVRFGKIEREIVAFGRRRGEIDALGRPRFSEPEPFDDIPIRWDYAYGGVDLVALRRRGMPYLKYIAPRPEYDVLTATPYHYPRNPCGTGFLIDLDEESFAGRLIPHLEHPFAPLLPERLAAGSLDGWIRCPMPAAWDFQPLEFFPRCAYLGLPPAYEDGDRAPAEIERGWAAKDLLTIPPFTQARGPGDMRPEVSLAAAPGMSIPGVSPDERFELTNMHRDKPVHTIDLPGEVPRVLFELRPGQVIEATPHLNTVVLRVDLDEVELVWSARVALPSDLLEDDFESARRVVQWQRPKEKG